MTIEDAFQQAIASGWHHPFFRDGDHIADLSQETKLAAFLNPPFWQSLGKALGWDRPIKYRQSIPARMVSRVSKNGVIKYAVPAHIRMMSKRTHDRWTKEWHRFIDHLAEGKDAESFFAQFDL
jgi:hypothetical protein